MSVHRSVAIDVELENVGQLDQTERWRGELSVTRESDGRVRMGKPTQAGFQAITFDLDDLIAAVPAAIPDPSATRVEDPACVSYPRKCRSAEGHPFGACRRCPRRAEAPDA